jgi:hypothetical protein
LLKIPVGTVTDAEAMEVMQNLRSYSTACTVGQICDNIGAVAHLPGTFGASPSSGYTFTSTPITTAPFSGNLLIGTIIGESQTSCSAGTGWTLDLGCTAPAQNVIGLEHRTAGATSSYSAAFGLSPTSVWGGTITAWSGSGTYAAVQINSTHGTSLAFSSPNTAGNFLIGIVRYQSTSPTGPVTSITDAGNTWKLVGLRAPEAATLGVGNGVVEEIWYAANCASGSHTFAPNGVAGGTVEIAIAEYSGVATSSPLVDYNYNADSTGNTSTTTPVGAITNNQYLYAAINNTTGVIDYGGIGNVGGVNSRDHASVFRAAAANLASKGGQLYHKNGIYVGQSSLQEVNNGQSGWYIFGLPPSPSGGNTQVTWDNAGETSYFNGNTNQNGTIFQALPSAWSGPGPMNGTLSVIWVRPASASSNNSVFFRNFTCRIPSNQIANTICVDEQQAKYSYHANMIADTVLGSGVSAFCDTLSPAAANVIGFRSNLGGTNETYFENTWAIGYNTPYSILSNHPVGINMHTYCNSNGGLINITNNTYGGQFIHYQELHDIIGLQLTCNNPGTRLDFLGTIREIVTSGLFTVTAGATETNPGNCLGTFDVTTEAANGSAYTAPVTFVSGGANMRVNESARLLKQGLVTSNFTSAATTGTTKQTLATFTFPYTTVVGTSGGIFNNNPGAVVRIKSWGINVSNTGNDTFEIDFGGTAIATITSTQANSAIRCEAEIIVSSVASTQEIVGTCDDGTLHTVTRTAPAITGTANIVTNIAMTSAAGAGQGVFKGMTIEYVGGQ